MLVIRDGRSHRKATLVGFSHDSLKIPLSLPSSNNPNNFTMFSKSKPKKARCGKEPGKDVTSTKGCTITKVEDPRNLLETFNQTLAKTPDMQVTARTHGQTQLLLAYLVIWPMKGQEIHCKIVWNTFLINHGTFCDFSILLSLTLIYYIYSTPSQLIKQVCRSTK